MAIKPVTIQLSPMDKSSEKKDKKGIKKIFAILSGKGGVGKSSITSLFASASNQLGYRTAVLDADLTGSSISKMLGVEKMLDSSENGIIPAKSKTGINFVSVNLLLENESVPVIWRGPILTRVIEQFYDEVDWSGIDIMFIDTPPNTSDVPLTVFKTLPLDGIILVNTPQSLSSMIVSKTINMAKMMDIKILGIIENMSYFLCPDNNKKYEIFGKSHIEEISEKYSLEILKKLPIDMNLVELCDKGKIDEIANNPLIEVLEKLMKEEK